MAWAVRRPSINKKEMKKIKLNSADKNVSSSDLETLENVHMSLAEQEEMNSASKGTPQLTDVRVLADSFETEPKSRKWKWLVGLCACIVIVGIIISDYIRKIK